MHSSDSQRDDIAHYLFQKFTLGNDCARPSQIRDKPILYLLARKYLNPLDFEQVPLSYQKDYVSLGVDLLVVILDCPCEQSVLDELSPKLEEVLKRKSKTLRPFLDILIARGVYPDPDLVVRPIVIELGRPMKVTDSEYAWQLEYQGTAHKTLLQNIQTSFKIGVKYSNSGAIIQSSGYGKSRTVDEMATLIPIIPMNVRPTADALQGAFPPSDASLALFFQNTRWGTFSNPIGYLLSFFKLLFELVHDLAKGFKKENFTAALYQCFKDQDRRAKLYTDLAEKMKQIPNEASANEAIASFQELARLFPESKGPVEMVIYIDSARNLASTIVAGTSLYEHMLAATAEFATVGVFFLFISTSSDTEILSSQPELSDSYRFETARGSLVAPFTELSFDCHPSLVKESIQPGLKLKEIQKYSFAVRFGRPLYWTYFEAVSRDKGEAGAWYDILAMAKGQLISSTCLSDTPENSGKLAILDTLLNFEYDIRSPYYHQVASKMVASHLRTVYSIPPSREYMHTGYPSEPVLAAAALSLVQTLPKGFGGLGTLFSLYDSLDSGISEAIIKGEHGENVGKMILLLAYIAAVKEHGFWGYGCGLVDFLKELTGDEFCRDVLISVPDNLKDGTSLEEAFKNSWVRFTHFARAADDSAMTSSMAYVAFIREMAMIACRESRRDVHRVDINIPILLDKDKPITEANMSSILVQFKAGCPGMSKVKVAVREHEIKYFPPLGSSRDAFPDPETPENVKQWQAYHSRPYISLVMELVQAVTPDNMTRFLDNHNSQSRTSQRDHKQDPSDSNLPPTPAPSVSTQTQHTSSGPIHPRYSLFYYGCSPKVYRCIPDKTAELACKTLLQPSPVFSGRPRNRPINPSILQMKPFWSAGPNCFSWVDEPYFKFEPTDSENELEEDLVLVGNLDDFDMDLDTVTC